MFFPVPRHLLLSWHSSQFACSSLGFVHNSQICSTSQSSKSQWSQKSPSLFVYSIIRSFIHDQILKNAFAWKNSIQHFLARTMAVAKETHLSQNDSLFDVNSSFQSTIWYFSTRKCPWRVLNWEWWCAEIQCVPRRYVGMMSITPTSSAFCIFVLKFGAFMNPEWLLVHNSLHLYGSHACIAMLSYLLVLENINSGLSIQQDPSHGKASILTDWNLLCYPFICRRLNWLPHGNNCWQRQPKSE